MNHTIRSRSNKGGALKVILITVGVIAVLGIVAIVGVGWFAKTKIDEAGGLQAVAGKVLTKGLEIMQPEIEKSLGAADKQRLADAVTQLKQSAASLSEEQLDGLNKALKTLAEQMKSGTASEADAKAFVDELTRVLAAKPSVTPAPE
jgi:hypothetical protein